MGVDVVGTGGSTIRESISNDVRVAPLSSVQELVGAEALSTCEVDWNLLCEKGIYREPFFQYDWVHAFIQTQLPVESRLVLSRVELAGVPIALLLLQRCKTFFRGLPARSLRSPSNVHSCRYDLVHRHDAREEAVAGIWRSLQEISHWDVIELLDVPEDGAFNDVVRTAQEAGYLTGRWPTLQSPYLVLQPSSVDEAIFPRARKDFRRRLRSKLKQLQSLGDVSFERRTSLEDGVFEEFIALEGSGWKGRRGTAIRLNPRLVRFYRSVAKANTVRGRCCFYTLRLGGCPIAMHFGLDNGSTYFAPKVAYDEKLSRYSPGQLLVRHIIDDLRSRGLERYEFLGPQADWKMVWATELRAHHNLYIFRPTLRGKFLHAASMKAGALARDLKRRLSGGVIDRE